MNRTTGKRRVRLAIAVLAVALIGVFWLLTSPRPTPQLLDAPPVERSPLAWLGRWAQPVRSFLSRMKFQVIGPPAAVTIRARLLEFDSAAAWHRVAPGQDLGSNVAGDRVWILPHVPEVEPMTIPGVQVIAKPTVSAIDGHRAQFSVTSRVATRRGFEDVGVQLDVLPQSRGDAIDLRAFIAVTEAGDWIALSNQAVVATIRTNAFFGAQVRLPKGSSLFLLSGRTNEAGRRIGALLWAGR
jgi:hypothetical protein